MGVNMNNIFEGISELQKNKLFKLLAAHIYSFNKNQEMLSTLTNDNIICVLLEGSANIVNLDYNGNEFLVESLSENSVFGTSISDINNNECHIRALKDSKVLVIDYNNLFNSDNMNHIYFKIFFNNLFEIMNNKLIEKNHRLSILTKKTIREKLLKYFEVQYVKKRSNVIYLTNSLKDLADYLAINRSAMFRELKNLKDEKFIKIDGKKVTLLYTPQIYY